MDRKVRGELRSLVAEHQEYMRWRGVTGWVRPKRGLVVQRSRWAPREIEGVYTARGIWVPLVPRHILGMRTVFRKTPLTINGERRYLELKGYGRDGRELTFSLHGSGNVWYGMFLENAQREFERLQRAADLQLPVPLPVAVVEIERPEYVRQGLLWLQEVLSIGIALRVLERGKIAGMVRITDSMDPNSIARRIISRVTQSQDPEVELASVVERLQTEEFTLGGITTQDLQALQSGKPIGYLIRASRCPIRVGDPSDKSIGTPRNQRVAIAMGRTFLTFLEHGILHHCPGTGNWTIAGEMTDLADTFDLETERQELARHMKGVGRITLQSFLSYLIGPEHTGVLCPFFLEGMYGNGVSQEEAVERMLALPCFERASQR